MTDQTEDYDPQPRQRQIRDTISMASMVPSEEESRKITCECRRCGSAFEVEQHLIGKTWIQLQYDCDRCLELSMAESDADEVRRIRDRISGSRPARLEDYERLCPFKGFNETDVSRIPASDEAINGVVNWNYRNNRSLFIVGESGLGKSRAVWLLLKRVYVDDGTPIKAIDCTDLSARFMEAIRSNNSGMLRDLVTEFINYPILYIDDFGKSVFTERYKEQLFKIIKERTERGRPIIFTSNYNSKTMLDRMAGDAAGETNSNFKDQSAEAIRRRLVEYCDGIRFVRVEKSEPEMF